MQFLKLWFLVLFAFTASMSFNSSPSVEGILVTYRFLAPDDVNISIKNDRTDDVILCIIIIQDNILHYEVNNFLLKQGETFNFTSEIAPSVSTPAMMLIYESGSSPSEAVRYSLE